MRETTEMTTQNPGNRRVIKEKTTKPHQDGGKEESHNGSPVEAGQQVLSQHDMTEKNWNGQTP